MIARYTSAVQFRGAKTGKDRYAFVAAGLMTEKDAYAAAG
jgi:hypothetical protein